MIPPATVPTNPPKSTRRVRHLVVAWCAYWTALALATVGPGVAAAAILDRFKDNLTDLTVNLGTGGIIVTLTRASAPIWDLTATIPELALWLAGPPLVLWGLWLARGVRARVAAGTTAVALEAGEMPTVAARDGVPSATLGDRD